MHADRDGDVPRCVACFKMWRTSAASPVTSTRGVLVSAARRENLRRTATGAGDDSDDGERAGCGCAWVSRASTFGTRQMLTSFVNECRVARDERVGEQDGGAECAGRVMRGKVSVGDEGVNDPLSLFTLPSTWSVRPFAHS